MTVVRPSMLYGVQCWALKKCEKARVNVVQMCMLRRIWRILFEMVWALLKAWNFPVVVRRSKVTWGRYENNGRGHSRPWVRRGVTTDISLWSNWDHGIKWVEWKNKTHKGNLSSWVWVSQHWRAGVSLAIQRVTIYSKTILCRENLLEKHKPSQDVFQNVRMYRV